MKNVLILGVVLALTACGNSSIIRDAMAGQLAAWNAAGVDPIQMDSSQLLYAVTACGTLSSLSTVINPSAPEMSAEVASWCGLAVKAAAPAE